MALSPGSAVNIGRDFWELRPRAAQTAVDKPFRDVMRSSAGLAAAFGLLQGSMQGMRCRGIQFLAENAHRTPRTKGGWYLYHKTKNYQMLAAGIKKGAERAVAYSLLPLLVVGSSELTARIYANAPLEPWNRLLRPRSPEESPLAVRIVGAGLGGWALGVVAHRYYGLPVWQRRLIYGRSALAGAVLGCFVQAYFLVADAAAG